MIRNTLLRKKLVQAIHELALSAALAAASNE